VIVTVIVFVGNVDGLVEALADVVTVAVLVPSLDVTPLAVGRYTDVEGGLDVQADTAAATSVAKMAQPATVSAGRRAVLVTAARTFIEPPHAPGRWRSFSPVPASEPPERKRTDDPGAARVVRRQASKAPMP
jgi:hypothetical protein